MNSVMVIARFFTQEVKSEVATHIESFLRNDIKFLCTSLKSGLKLDKNVRLIVKIERDVLSQANGFPLHFVVILPRTVTLPDLYGIEKKILRQIHEFCWDLYDVAFEVRVIDASGAENKNTVLYTSYNPSEYSL